MFIFIKIILSLLVVFMFGGLATILYAVKIASKDSEYEVPNWLFGILTIALLLILYLVTMLELAYPVSN